MQKPQGMKHTSFSNFNDPFFNAIAAKIGIDVTSLNDGIECSTFITHTKTDLKALFVRIFL